MKRLAIYVIVLFPFALQAQPVWDVEMASVTFEIENAGLPVHGTFEGFEANIRLDPERPERSVFFASIDASTVRTGIRLRDRHLRKHDYFSVENYPRIHMECLSVEKIRDDAFEGLFRLQIKETAQDVTVPFTFVRSGEGGRLAGYFSINRLDFGLGEPSIILSDTVNVSVKVDLTPVE